MQLKVKYNEVDSRIKMYKIELGEKHVNIT